MLPLTTKARLETRYGVDQLARWSKGIDANITEAIATAGDMFRDAALNKFTPESIDALTAETVSAVAQFNIESLVGELLTTAVARPESIRVYGDDARKWLSYVAGGSAAPDGLVPRSSASGTGSNTVSRVREKARVFSSSNAAYAARFPDSIFPSE